MILKREIANSIYSIPGWRTDRHIVVVESDDWGSVRMPSKDAYDNLLKSGIRVDKCHYCKNDSIASETDLSLLFETLHYVKDKNGRSAVITANAVVANPDFDKIKEFDFKRYSFKTIDQEMACISGCEHSLDLWKEGNNDGFFVIQSHGREHLNVSRWMHYLKDGYPETRLAFDLGVYGVSTTITSEKRKSFLPAFDFETSDEEKQVNAIAVDGLNIFHKIFGFDSKSFIAPNYTWGKSLEKVLFENGVRFIQGQQIARYIDSEGVHNKRRLRYVGRRNEYGMIDLSRNAFFEPSENPEKDWVDSCLADIEIAFRWKHPAIICSHRVNYVGTINVTNRVNGLRSLKALLQRIKNKWPDVEFMSSVQLGDLIVK